MPQPTLLFNESEPLRSLAASEFLVRCILPDAPAGDVTAIARALFRPGVAVSPAAASAALRKALAAQANTPEELRRVAKVLDHEARTAENAGVYLTAGRENPDAVWYPNPLRFPHPGSVEQVDLYARQHKIIDRSTPITSAGSCFAMEIAHRLQALGFNYVITEPYVHAGSRWAMSSAAWGTIFNAAAMRQLVEKAFRARELPRLLWRVESDGKIVYRDPYREEIEFASVAEYEDGYDRHIDACRDALLAAEVFVITLGLTEIWRVRADGSVLSRVPWRLSSSLVERHVLSVEDNVAELRTMAALLRRHNPNVQFVVSVSPVPLLATFRGDTHHVVEASAHAKAVLRVAAEQFCTSTPGAWYFPAFEQVMYGSPNPFDHDQRHVRRATVARVMRLFDTTFVRDPSYAAATASARVPSPDPVRLVLAVDWSGDPARLIAATRAYLRAWAPNRRMELVVLRPTGAAVSLDDAYQALVAAYEAEGLTIDGGPAVCLEDGAPADTLLSTAPLLVRAGTGRAEEAALHDARRRGAHVVDIADLSAFAAALDELDGVSTTVDRVLASAPAEHREAGRRMVSGWRTFATTGTTPHHAYQLYRQLYCATRGALRDALRAVAAQAYPPVPEDPTGLLGSGADVAAHAQAVREDGVSLIGRVVSSDVCARLVTFASEAPCMTRTRSGVVRHERWDRSRPLAPTGDLDESLLVTHPDVAALAADPSLRALARETLGCEPVLDLIAMWWSAPFGGGPSSLSAQLYHFDMDRPNFVKIFIYLLDTDDTSGPHAMIPGSHRERPADRMRDGRHTDEEVYASFGRERERRLVGPAGTMFAEDTAAFHKGTEPTARERLVLQFEFASSLFGAPYQRHPRADVHPTLRAAAEKHPRVFQRFYP